MTHIREQIRTAIVDALTGLPLTGARVYAARRRPKAESDLPFLVVFTAEEASQPLTTAAPRRLSRQMTLHVVAYARASDDFDAALDALAAEIEPALAADPHLAGLAKDITLTRTEFAHEADAAVPVGAMRLTYLVTTHTREGAPDATI